MFVEEVTEVVPLLPDIDTLIENPDLTQEEIDAAAVAAAEAIIVVEEVTDLGP